MNIYLSREGQTFGPYTVEQAREYLATGQFLPGDHALLEGQTEWRYLAELIEDQPGQDAVASPAQEALAVEVAREAPQTPDPEQEQGDVAVLQNKEKPGSAVPSRRHPKKISGKRKDQSTVVKPKRGLGSKILSTFVVFLLTALVFGGVVTGLYFAMPSKIGPILANLGFPLADGRKEPIQEQSPVQKAQSETPGELMLDEDQAQRLRISGIRILPIAGDTGLQIVSSPDPESSVEDDDLSALSPVADQLVSIDLTQSRITDRGLDQLIEMKNLERLTLEGVKEITTDGIAKLKPEVVSTYIYFQPILAFLPLLLECYFLIVLTFDDQNYVVRILFHLLLDPLH